MDSIELCMVNMIGVRFQILCESAVKIAKVERCNLDAC